MARGHDFGGLALGEPVSRRTPRDYARVGGGSQAEFLGQLLDAIPAPVFYKDAQQVYRGCNTAFERFLGRRVKTSSARRVFELSPARSRATLLRSGSGLAGQPARAGVRGSRWRPAEGRRVVVFHKATYVDESGGSSGIVGIILDITERRQAEDALRGALEDLREANERLRLASRSLSTPRTRESWWRAGLALDDAAYQIVDVNDAYCRLTGRSKEETLGGRLDSLLQEDSSPGSWRCRRGLAARDRVSGKARYSSPGPTVRRCLRGCLFPWCRTGEEPATSVVGILTDLTEIKKALGGPHA